MQQPPQQFCLRWNNYQSNLTNVFDQLLQSESFVDVTLACEGHSVKAHKMVLSACSPYFQALFFDNPCQHPIVILKDIKWPELKAAVEFMYKGEINVSQEQIGPLLKVAESLKIRGLADVGSGGGGGGGGGGSSGGCEPEANGASTPPHHHQQHQHGGGGGGDAASVSPSSTPQPPSTPTALAHAAAAAAAAASRKPWDLSAEGCLAASPGQRGAHPHQAKKRRRSAGERSVSSPEDSPSAPTPAAVAAAELLDDVPLPPQPQAPQQPPPQQPQPPPQQPPPPGPALGPEPGLPLPPPPPPQQAQPAPHPEDLEIKPGIAEMIREEERAKLLESSHAWLGASTSSIADSYQYQLQSMWQKCWNTNQSLVHNLRFRERGPLKSWRPETMAEAIFSVLREGLSLSQAARKYDIPYPTFVLYANRVHNMLGPSTDGGADLRPKGRGRPQRILLGSWPEEHIHGVIRAVVFRDTQHIKDDSHLAYPRLTSHTQARRSPLPTNLVSRYVSSPLAVGGFSQHIKEDPDLTYSHLAQQMQETLQGYGASAESGPSCTNGPDTTMSPGVAAAAAVAVMAQGLRQQMCSVGATDATVAGLAGSLGLCLPPPHTHSHPATSNGGASPAVSGSPSPPAVPSPLASVGLGGGMPYKPPPSFSSPRPETLFQEDIEEIVKSPNIGSSPQNLVKEAKEPTPVPVKLESSVEAQDE